MMVRRPDPNIDSVLQWFQFRIELLNDDLMSVTSALPAGTGVMASPRRPRRSRFIGLTGGEVGEFFAEQANQTESFAMFEILATTEAILRTDFKDRVKTEKRDELSRLYRDIDKERDNVRLDEDILEAMKKAGVAVGDFRGALKLRHWLAHGRWWQPKLGRNYTPQIVFDVSRVLIESIP
jgi:hypothetical protein